MLQVANRAVLQAHAPIVWDECACPLCASAQFTPVLEAPDVLRTGLRFLIAQCTNCGLCCTNPRPDLASMERFYPADYHCHRSRDQATRADPMERWLPEPARLLDFGCGAGGFLLRMRELGWTVTGIELADSVAIGLRDRHGLDVHAGSLPSARWPDAAFEAITMRQSLEHVHAPLEVLRGAWRLLTLGGRLLVSVPNFDALPASWFGPHWYALDLPRHLTHFTLTTLGIMLRAAGFTDIDIRMQPHASWIRHSARPLGRRLLTTRLGSGVASRVARALGRSEALLAIATKS